MIFSEIQSCQESIIDGVLGSFKYVCAEVSHKRFSEKVAKEYDDNVGLQFENHF